MTRLYRKIHIGVSIMSLKSWEGIWCVCLKWVEARADRTKRVFFVVMTAWPPTLALVV